MGFKAFTGGLVIGAAAALAITMTAIPAAGAAVREATGLPSAVRGLVEPAVQAQEQMDKLREVLGEGAEGCGVEAAQLAAIAQQVAEQVEGFTAFGCGTTSGEEVAR